MAAQRHTQQHAPLALLRKLPAELHLKIFEYALPTGFSRTLLNLLLAVAGDEVIVGEVWDVHRKLNAKSKFGTMSFYHYSSRKCQKAHKLGDLLLDYQDGYVSVQPLFKENVHKMTRNPRDSASQSILELYWPIGLVNNLSITPLGSDHVQNHVTDAIPDLTGVREIANIPRGCIRVVIKMYYFDLIGPNAADTQQAQFKMDIVFLIGTINKEFDVVGMVEHIKDGPEGFEIWSWERKDVKGGDFKVAPK